MNQVLKVKSRVVSVDSIALVKPARSCKPILIAADARIAITSKAAGNSGASTGRTALNVRKTTTAMAVPWIAR